MNYKEFPDIAVPEFLQAEGWDDTSYHNDAEASSTRELKYGGAVIVVWVNFDDIAMREITGSTKYVVTVRDEDGKVGLITLLETEDAQVASDLVSRFQYTDGEKADGK